MLRSLVFVHGAAAAEFIDPVGTASAAPTTTMDKMTLRFRNADRITAPFLKRSPDNGHTDARLMDFRC